MNVQKNGVYPALWELCRTCAGLTALTLVHCFRRERILDSSSLAAESAFDSVSLGVKTQVALLDSEMHSPVDSPNRTSTRSPNTSKSSQLPEQYVFVERARKSLPVIGRSGPPIAQ